MPATMIQMIAPNDHIHEVAHGVDVYPVKDRRVNVPISLSIELTKGVHGFRIATDAEIEQPQQQRNILKLKKHG